MKSHSAHVPYLKMWRYFRCWHYQDMARAAGLSNSYVSQLERGIRNVSRETILKLAEALYVDPEQLVNERPQGMTPPTREKYAMA